MTFGLWNLSIFASITLMILKLTHVISTSWVWVFAPVWITVGLGIILLIAALAVAGMVIESIK